MNVNDTGLKRDIIVLGASAGGVEALLHIFERLPAGLPAALAAVQHRHPLYNVHLAEVLAKKATLPLIEGNDSGQFNPGCIYLAPRDSHMILTEAGIDLTRAAKEHFTRPAIDPLFRSAAKIYGGRVVGVLLTGAGDDGVDGLIAIKAAGGVSIIQDPEEAKVPFMVINALLYDHVDLILSLNEIPATLSALALGQSVSASPRVHDSLKPSTRGTTQ